MDHGIVEWANMNEVNLDLIDQDWALVGHVSLSDKDLVSVNSTNIYLATMCLFDIPNEDLDTVDLVGLSDGNRAAIDWVTLDQAVLDQVAMEPLTLYHVDIVFVSFVKPAALLSLMTDCGLCSLCNLYSLCGLCGLCG